VLYLRLSCSVGFFFQAEYVIRDRDGSREFSRVLFRSLSLMRDTAVLELYSVRNAIFRQEVAAH